MIEPESVGSMEVVEVNGIEGVRRGDIISAMVPVDLLVPTEGNPNMMSQTELAILNETVAENGFLDPIAAIPRNDGKTFLINGGEHRWKVAKARGMRLVPVDIMYDPKWQDEELQEFQLVKFNVIKGKMDPEKMLKLYNKVADKHGPEKVSQLLGYADDKALNKVIKQVSKQMKETLPPEVAEQFEKEAKEAKSITDLNKIIQQIFSEHGDTVRFSFMVFAFGGKEHIYISSSKTTHNAMKKITAYCKEKHVDINDLLEDVLLGVANTIGGKGA